MMKKLAFFLFFFNSYYLFSQNNVLKTSPFSIINGTISVSYERLIKPNLSLQLRWRYDSPINLLSRIIELKSSRTIQLLTNNSTFVFNNIFEGLSFAPEMKCYFKPSKVGQMQGLYWANGIQYDFFTLSDSYFAIQNGIGSEAASVYQHNVRVGTYMGCQFMARRFSLDIFGGGNAGISHFIITMNGSDASDNAIGLIEILKPQVAKQVRFHENPLYSEVKGTFPFYQLKMGIMVGYCF